MSEQSQLPHFSFRGFLFLVVFCTMCFASLLPGGKPSVDAWLLFIALMVYAIFMEVWRIGNPRPEKEEQ